LNFRKDVIAYLNGSKKDVENLERHIELMKPVNVLKRGYSITSINGKVVQKVDDVKKGDLLKTVVSDGQITSVAKKINKTE